MTHPFQDKLFVFIGTPVNHTRQTARDALTAVGGVVDDRLSVFAHYAVAFNGAERTKVYRKALERDRLGNIILLTEQQFFDILDGKAAPPEKKTPPRKNGVVFIPANDPDAEERDFEKARQHFIERKRLLSMARHGVPMPDGGRAMIDLRPLDMARRVSEQSATLDCRGRQSAPYDRDAQGRYRGWCWTQIFNTAFLVHAGVYATVHCFFVHARFSSPRKDLLLRTITAPFHRFSRF